MVVHKNPGNSSVFTLVVTKILEIPAYPAWWFTKILETPACSAWRHAKQAKNMPTYLHTDFTSFNDSGAHGKGPLLGLSATGPDWEGGACIFKISWPKIIHHKFGKDLEYACGTHTLHK